MEGIKISTTQNVDLEYEPAGVGYRLLAAFLDSIFMLAYVFLLLIVTSYFSKIREVYEDHDYLTLTLFIVALLPVALYHFLSEQFMNGQSFGKKIVKIKVVKLDGTQPGIGSYALRSLLRIIDIHLINGLVAIISIAVTDKSQRLGDMAAGTTVIRMGRRMTLQDTILYRQVNDYKILFEQVALLTDRDMAIIKEVLDHAVQNNKPENLRKLAARVKTKMGVSSNLNDEVFLKTVLLDYSHYQFER